MSSVCVPAGGEDGCFDGGGHDGAFHDAFPVVDLVGLGSGSGSPRPVHLVQRDLDHPGAWGDHAWYGPWALP